MIVRSPMLWADTEQFPAVLKTPEGEILEEGAAQVCVPEQTVTFTNDFVPLHLIGTPLEIVRIFNGREVHRFSGTVYLSDRELLRLTRVDDELLPGAEDLYCSVDFTGKAQLCVEPSPRKPSLFSKPVPEEPYYPTRVTEMTSQQLVFLYDSVEDIPVGTQFHLKLDAPFRLPELLIELETSGPFIIGQQRLCHYVGLKEADRKNLQEFLAIYTHLHHKLF